MRVLRTRTEAGTTLLAEFDAPLDDARFEPFTQTYGAAPEDVDPDTYDESCIVEFRAIAELEAQRRAEVLAADEEVEDVPAPEWEEV